MPRSLYVLLEGNDDKRFFDSVFKPEFLKKYDSVMSYLYAQRSKKNRDRMVNILKRRRIDYIIFSDFDEALCVTKSKAVLQTKIPSAESAKIAVPKNEIESWYLAGLDYSSTRKLRIPFYTNTETVSKEQFDYNRSTSSDSKIDFMQEILKLFNVGTAKKQNNSFKYVWHKFVF